MKVLALYLLEEFETDKGMTKQMSEDDFFICRAAEDAGHQVEKRVYSSKALKQAKDFDVVLNMCDGFEDDNSFVEIKVAKNLEKTGVNFTGNKASAFELCNDKAEAKKTLQAKRISTACFQVCYKIPKELDKKLSFPVIVKPVKSDAAAGIYPDSVANNLEELKKCVKRVLKQRKQPALVEPYLEGPEFCVPVIGNEKPKALRALKVKYKSYFSEKPKILSYDAKWEKKSSEYLNVRTRALRKPHKKAQELAEKAFKALNLRGYASIDIRANKKGKLFVIDVNPNCWLGFGSDLSKSAKAANITQAQLIDKILKLA